MNGSPDHPWWHWFMDLSLGVTGAALSILAGMGIKGLRNMLRELAESKLRIEDLERRLRRMEDMDQPR